MSRWIGCGVVIVASCVSVQTREVAEPRALVGEALEWARAALGRHRAQTRRPGSETESHGEQVAYDDYCHVGSEFGEDRAGAFHAFAKGLLARGCEYRSLEVNSRGEVTKLLVVVDGERIVFSYLRW
ncbi:MAG: hypothetical protein FJ298_12070 [Planctomycetes bacterium]|nr:hypothetical protein [Planctomycetota bacterium]